MLDAVVVLPTFNEADNLVAIVAEILERGVEVLIVDDASPDGTGALADTIAAENPRVSVLHRTAKTGLGSAYAAGFVAALERGAATLIEMDADFSHDPSVLPRLIQTVADGADVAIGSRYVVGGGVSGWSTFRRLLSRGANTYARALLGSTVHDLTSGYRAYSAKAIRELQPATCEAAGYAFQVEMAWRAELAHLRIAEVPITFKERVAGESKMNAGIALEAVRLITWWGVRRLARRLPWPPREV